MTSLLPPDLYALAQRVVAENAAAGRKVALAESCTGGLVCAALTEIPGSSAVLDRGFVTYSAEAKQDLLGLSADLVDCNDAVSAEVAKAMAEGALSRCNADIALSVTGFAGPGGPEHEEGLVYMACAVRNAGTQVEERHFGAIGRGPVRIETLKVLVDMLCRAIDEA